MSTAVEYRDRTLAGLKPELAGLRKAVYEAWQRFGPGTTREVARRSGIDLLTFRPRTTELYQMGLVCVHEGDFTEGNEGNEGADARSPGQAEACTTNREGVYRARLLHEWESWRDEQRKCGQLQLI